MFYLLNKIDDNPVLGNRLVNINNVLCRYISLQALLQSRLDSAKKAKELRAIRKQNAKIERAKDVWDVWPSEVGSTPKRIASLMTFRHVILSYYWRILAYYNQFRKRKHYVSRLIRLKTLSRLNFKSTDRTFMLNRLFRSKKRLLRLKKKEKAAWQKYLARFRLWYDIYRFGYTRQLPVYNKLCRNIVFAQREEKTTQQRARDIFVKNPTIVFTKLFRKKLLDSTVHIHWARLNTKVKKTQPLFFNNFYYLKHNRLIAPWRSRRYWTLRSLTSLFRKKTFFRRFFTFRIERVRHKKKHTKRRKSSNFLRYSHERFQKFRLFYTTLGYRQFQHLFQNIQCFKKNAAVLITSVLELRLEFFLYRINFAPSKYFAKQFLLHNTFFVNNRLIKNRNYILRVGDTVTVSTNRFDLVFNNLLARLRNMKHSYSQIKNTNPTNISVPLIFSNPRYVEVDYGLLSATIFRTPKVSDIFVPLYIELDPLNRSLTHIYNSYL